MIKIPSEHPEVLSRFETSLNRLKAIEEDIPAVVTIHSIESAELIYMSERGRKILGTTLEELATLGIDYYTRYFNPEDAKDYVPKIMGLLERNNNDEMVSYFQQVRTSAEAAWNWYSSCTKIFLRNEYGNPLLTITTSIPIDPVHFVSAKVERLLDENTFLQKHKNIFASLSKRELEILRRMALGQNSIEIAKELYISEATAKTHRRNIRKKINAESSYDITRFAQAFNII
jgi:DNA-binding CsgD family transcriptional regulator